MYAKGSELRNAECISATRGETMNNLWTSVYDELPEKNAMVLGYGQRNIFAPYRPMVVKWAGNGWVNVTMECYVSVTHWMPLPDMPKEV